MAIYKINDQESWEFKLRREYQKQRILAEQLKRTVIKDDSLLQVSTASENRLRVPLFNLLKQSGFTGEVGQNEFLILSSRVIAKHLKEQKSHQLAEEEVRSYKSKYLIKRPDLFFPGANIAVEIDGESHNRSDAQRSDKVADYEYAPHGIYLYRIGNSELSQAGIKKHTQDLVNLIQQRTRELAGSKEYKNQKSYRSKLLTRFLKDISSPLFRTGFSQEYVRRLDHFLSSFQKKNIEEKDRQPDFATKIPRVRYNGGFRSFFNSCTRGQISEIRKS